MGWIVVAAVVVLLTLRCCRLVTFTLERAMVRDCQFLSEMR